MPCKQNRIGDTLLVTASHSEGCSFSGNGNRWNRKVRPSAVRTPEHATCCKAVQKARGISAWRSVTQIKLSQDFLQDYAMRYAESIKVKIEDLASAMSHHHAPRDDTACWVAALDDCMIAKLERVGLIPPRITITLEEWLEQYLAERKDDLKPESLRKLQQTKTKMLAFFDTGTEFRKITVQQATGWRQFLRTLKLSEAAIKTHSGNAKTMVNEAIQRKLIEDNPFAFLRSGPTPSMYSRYVTPEDSARMIDACPNTEWKLLFGLARYAGLRIPSESQMLTWKDVDFERSRLKVRSPKTERHAGHEQRIVPITPKLMTLLQDHFAEVEEGQRCLVTIRGKGAVIRKFQTIWQRAGVEPWKRLW